MGKSEKEEAGGRKSAFHRLSKKRIHLQRSHGVNVIPNATKLCITFPDKILLFSDKILMYGWLHDLIFSWQSNFGDPFFPSSVRFARTLKETVWNILNTLQVSLLISIASIAKLRGGEGRGGEARGGEGREGEGHFICVHHASSTGNVTNILLLIFFANRG